MSFSSKWKSLWQPTNKKWLFGIPIGAFLALAVGAIGVTGFNVTMHATSTNEFCYSCHVGMDTIVEEYEASKHFHNASGVGPTCADCHIPKEFIPKMITKTIAMKDVYHMMVGTVNMENFEDLREGMAKRVWDDMIANDSRECRNCHTYENMDLEKQEKRARKKHTPEGDEGKTCIECHKGVAHKLPEEDLDDLFDDL